VLEAVRWELFKVYRRPGNWVLLILLLALLVLFAYALAWILLTHPPQSLALPPGTTAQSLKRGLYPAHFVSVAAQQGGIPAAIALIFGVLLTGSEYGWDTVKILFTLAPRARVLAVKLSALLVTLLAAAILYLSLSAAASVVVAAVDGQSLTNWPSAGDIARGLLVIILTWALWALLGALLAALFRQSALAIGIGLGYMFAIEGLLLGVAGAFPGSFLHNVQKAFPGPNAGALTLSLGPPPPIRTLGSSTQAVVSAEQATLVLLAYCVAMAAVAAWTLLRRDVH
jgi:ABC-type transport system involved in multi-copper enzyme maturation permease subunit